MVRVQKYDSRARRGRVGNGREFQMPFWNCQLKRVRRLKDLAEGAENCGIRRAGSLPGRAVFQD